ncbi:AAA family ATPase [Blastococcus brunescens]|uniref:AAA family ATPase n=1 Tax=Blastococcus brunescens TaxID=1564165 RepID=A0ABZ1B7S6_9ACTN|nr:AAA family ATPase [Blastococcus sp. BMG 8361]WRL66855.1 AAA family ATPase [Blastococcus sp. BMG 8361]
MLGVRPGSARFRHDRGNPLPLDVVVVDEASMVSLTLFARLLEALPDSARLVLVGDPDQLAAVEAGAVLADLTAEAGDGARTAARLAQLRAAVPDDVPADAPVAPETPAARVRDGIGFLRTVRRFDAGGHIAELAQRIREGDGEAALTVLRAGGAVRFLEVADGAAVTGAALSTLRTELLAAARPVLEAARAGDSGAALHALERHRLMCAHRKGRAASRCGSGRSSTGWGTRSGPSRGGTVATPGCPSSCSATTTTTACSTGTPASWWPAMGSCLPPSAGLAHRCTSRSAAWGTSSRCAPSPCTAVRAGSSAR